jgi:tetratricopeptide (TPR) repeat protein
VWGSAPPPHARRRLEAQALSAHVDIHLAEGHLDQAVESAREALAIHREIGHRLGEARTLRTLGHASRRSADTAAATAYWQQALALFTDIGNPEAHACQALLDRL